LVQCQEAVVGILVDIDKLRRTLERDGTGRNNMAFTTLNAAVLAPMPMATMSTAVAVKAGAWTNWRAEYFRSRMNDSIGFPRRAGRFSRVLKNSGAAFLFTPTR